MEWISDRLPEKNGDYLVWCTSRYSTPNTSPSIAVASFNSTSPYGLPWQPDCEFISGYDFEVDRIDVVAWMPLPPPPVEQGKEGEG